MEEQAQAAYEFLRERVHGVSPVSGRTLPPWGELDSAVTDAWVAAVQATEDAVALPPPEDPLP
jgi:hypothetical protein